MGHISETVATIRLHSSSSSGFEVSETSAFVTEDHDYSQWWRIYAHVNRFGVSRTNVFRSFWVLFFIFLHCRSNSYPGARR